jgi:phosphoserine aminotransferase
MAHNRVFNFSAGPAVLPLAVLEQVQSELLNYRGTGMSVMEMSHRSKPYQAIIDGAEASLRELLNLSADYAVMFLQGGATLQFAMVPMNLRPAGGSADYVITGAWAQAAYKEAAKLGAARVAGSSEAVKFASVPDWARLDLDPQAAYLHFTTNETIGGIAFRTDPAAPAGVPLVADVSSDFLSRPMEVSRYGLLYAGAQKNLGPAGATIVIIRRDLLERVPAGLPLMLDYKVQVENGSMYNTPPAFTLYVVGLVLQWLQANGGLAAALARNQAKAAHIYEAIDQSGGFYRGVAQPEARSLMNLTFRLPSEELEKAFIKQAEAEGFSGLKGHRSVGGLRASIYNAFPAEGAAALAQFMREYQRANG